MKGILIALVNVAPLFPIGRTRAYTRVTGRNSNRSRIQRIINSRWSSVPVAKLSRRSNNRWAEPSSNKAALRELSLRSVGEPRPQTSFKRNFNFILRLRRYINLMLTFGKASTSDICPSRRDAIGLFWEAQYVCVRDINFAVYSCAHDRISRTHGRDNGGCCTHSFFHPRHPRSLLISRDRKYPWLRTPAKSDGKFTPTEFGANTAANTNGKRNKSRNGEPTRIREERIFERAGENLIEFKSN